MTNMQNKIQIIKANYNHKKDAQDLLFLLDQYAQDPMGGAEKLSENTLNNLITEMQNRAHLFSVLAYVDQKAVGLINCIESFSTFKAKTVINIHDVVVLKNYRGQGISTLMLQKVKKIALQKNACKLTLEVLSENRPAKSSYQNFGFTGYELLPKFGKAEFWEKLL